MRLTGIEVELRGQADEPVTRLFCDQSGRSHREGGDDFMKEASMCSIALARTSMVLFVATSLLAAGWRTSAAQESSVGCSPATPAAASATPQSSTAPGTPAARGIAETSVRFEETDALLWRAGAYGVVLSHGAAYDAASWRPQAEAISAGGTTVLALEQTSPEDILAALRFLRQACGIAEVALIGASAGASTALIATAMEPEAVDQLIILSGTGDVSTLGDQPKLFVASEGEGLADATRQMAEDAPGASNEALILPGDAHAQAIFMTEQGNDLLQTILNRLEAQQAEAA